MRCKMILGSPRHHHQNRPRRATSSSRSKTSGARPTRRQRKPRSRRTCAARPATSGGCSRTRTGPTRCATSSLTPRRSYAETRARAARVGGWLRLHLTAGDRVALVAPNSLLAFEAHYACAFAGLTLLNCNPRLAPSELKWCLEHAGCKVLIVDGVYRDLAAAARTIK